MNSSSAFAAGGAVSTTNSPPWTCKRPKKREWAKLTNNYWRDLSNLAYILVRLHDPLYPCHGEFCPDLHLSDGLYVWVRHDGRHARCSERHRRGVHWCPEQVVWIVGLCVGGRFRGFTSTPAVRGCCWRQLGWVVLLVVLLFLFLLVLMRMVMLLMMIVE